MLFFLGGEEGERETSQEMAQASSSGLLIGGMFGFGLPGTRGKASLTESRSKSNDFLKKEGDPPKTRHFLSRRKRGKKGSEVLAGGKKRGSKAP